MKALIVDDSIYMRSMIKTILEKEGFEIAGEAANGEQAIDMSIELEPDLITLDNILPDMKGVDILLSIYEEGLTSKVIMVSAVGQNNMQLLAKERGAIEYIVKPFQAPQLISAVRKVMAIESISK